MYCLRVLRICYIKFPKGILYKGILTHMKKTENKKKTKINKTRKIVHFKNRVFFIAKMLCNAMNTGPPRAPQKGPRDTKGSPRVIQGPPRIPPEMPQSTLRGTLRPTNSTQGCPRFLLKKYTIFEKTIFDFFYVFDLLCFLIYDFLFSKKHRFSKK